MADKNMAKDGQTVLAEAEKKIGRAAVRRFGVVLTSVAVWCAVLFAAAGTLAWPRAWAMVGLYLLGLALNAAAVALKNPGLAAARSERRPGTKRFDRYFGFFYVLTIIAAPVVAGLDAVRYEWAPLPLYTAYPGAAMMLAGSALVAWAMAVNPFLETTVRIQDDRGHRVITRGPYALVRHPMYLGAILQHTGTPLILGSGWALVPAAIQLGLFIFRIMAEDRTLQRELAGYSDYARTTRWRLLPGLW